MKSVYVLILLSGIIFSCSTKSAVDPEEGNRFSGEWTAAKGGAGGWQDAASFKNYQLEYTVEGNSQEISYLLTSSDLDVAFVLYKANGEVLDISGKGRNETRKQVLNAGKYRIAILAERDGVGKFELVVEGILQKPVPVSFERISSGAKAWSELGGGGLYVTPKNHMYTFEVTEDNVFVDLELSSNNTNVGLYITNKNGEFTEYIAGNRSHFLVRKFNKGTYGIMAATHVRGAKGNYQLNLYGNVRNLKQTPVNERAIEGSWANGADVKVYDVEVVDDIGMLDVELGSPSYSVAMQISDSKGNYDIQHNANNVFGAYRVSKGVYRISVKPHFYTSQAGGYKLTLVGNFK